VIERPLVGAFAGALVVAFAVVAAEAVAGFVIDIAGDVRMGFLDVVNLAERDAAVIIAEIEDHRHFRSVFALGVDAAAIEGRRRRQAVAMTRRQPADIAAKAIADDADLARVRRFVYRGLNIGLDTVVIQAAAGFTAFLKIVLAVAQLKTLFDAVEQSRAIAT